VEEVDAHEELGGHYSEIAPRTRNRSALRTVNEVSIRAKYVIEDTARSLSNEEFGEISKGD
jgi:hypothetical protein